MQAGVQRLSARALLAAFSGALSACILLVPSAESSGDHCRFAGIESACGACLADHCAQAVDACCADDTCGGVVADVQRCAEANDADACARLEDADDRGGAHRDLSACAASQCGTLCGPPAAPKNVTRCKPAYVTSVEACSCELDSKPNDVACTEVGHPKLRCCAPDAWPGPALSCDCLTIICVPVSDGCLCQLTAMDDNERASECSGAHCCADRKTNQCRCGTADCHDDEVAVPSCNIEQFACTAGRHRVDACSLAAPPN